MSVQPISVPDLIQPVTPESVVTLVIVGFALGTVFFSRSGMSAAAFLYSLSFVGVAFFVPYSIWRNLDGATAWSRNLGALVLWLAFSLAIAVGVAWRQRR